MLIVKCLLLLFDSDAQQKGVSIAVCVDFF